MPLMGTAPSRPDETVVQARILKALQEVALAAGGVLDPTELARLAIDHARDLVGGWSATLAWVAADGNARALADNHPAVFPSVALEPGRGMTGQILLTGELTAANAYPGSGQSVGW